jgi:hypothetical protein
MLGKVLTVAMYNDMTKTIGDNTSILIGRTMERRKCSFGVLPVSRAERRSSFPVSFRRRCVLRSRITGAYDSRMHTAVKMQDNPA